MVFVCETKCVFVENGFVVSLCVRDCFLFLSLSLVTAHLFTAFLDVLVDFLLIYLHVFSHNVIILFRPFIGPM